MPRFYKIPINKRVNAPLSACLYVLPGRMSTLVECLWELSYSLHKSIVHSVCHVGSLRLMSMLSITTLFRSQEASHGPLSMAFIAPPIPLLYRTPRKD